MSSFAGASRHLGIIKIEREVLVDTVLSSYVLKKQTDIYFDLWRDAYALASFARVKYMGTNTFATEVAPSSFSPTSPGHLLPAPTSTYWLEKGSLHVIGGESAFLVN